MPGVPTAPSTASSRGQAGGERAGNHRAPRRRPRRWRRLLTAAAGLLVLVLTAGAAWLAALPSVATAPARVRRLLAAHGGSALSVPPPHRLGVAVVAAEDAYFTDNLFVNAAAGVGRAALAVLRRPGDPGGSTIPQQLAKQLWPHRPGAGTTLEDFGLGIKLGLRYRKARILAMYLDSVYLGNGYWGARAAAEGYFGRSPARLDWAQASLLAGLLQAPSAYDPLRHRALAKQRQRYVLEQLASTGKLSPAGAERAYAAPLGLRTGAGSHH